LKAVNIFYGKGYVVKVWNTDGFSFLNSIIADSGQIGLYIGNYKYGPSRNILVADSTFAKSRANGVAIQGAIGSPSSPIKIENNLFLDNHWHGVWPVAHGPKGALTTGGQLLIADGQNILVSGNVIANGVCGSCWHSQAVAAIELGDSPAKPGGVEDVKIVGNDFLNGMSHPVTNNLLNGVDVPSLLYRNGMPYQSDAIAQNSNTLVDGLIIQNNRVTGFDGLLHTDTKPVLKDNVVGRESSASGKPYLWVEQEAGRHFQVKSTSKSLNGFGFLEVPTVDSNQKPLVWCLTPETNAVPFVSESAQCRNPDRISDIIGYTTKKPDAGQQIAYLCTNAKSSQLSWEPNCSDGMPGRSIGYVVRGARGQ
jgi:hypothetical protein